jgi:hypothetical protein
MPSYVRAGIRKCARIRALSHILQYIRHHIYNYQPMKNKKLQTFSMQF